ncbi:Uncharacterised protein [Vibrio cholerae]|nr:Uncharacterised protein [Vibrio cholerae]
MAISSAMPRAYSKLNHLDQIFVIHRINHVVTGFF